MNKKVAFLLSLFFVLVVIGFAVTGHDDSGHIAAVGEPTPDFDLLDINSEKVTLSSLKGSVVFMNFWATWCASCVDELPSIQSFFTHFSEHPDIKILTVLFKDDIHTATEYMSRNNYSFPLYVPMEASAGKKYGITGVPETFIIDKQGILREKIIGPARWDTPRVFEIFTMLANEPG